MTLEVEPFDGPSDYVAAEARCAEAIVEHKRMSRLRHDTPNAEVLACMWADVRTYASIHGIDLAEIVRRGRVICGEDDGGVEVLRTLGGDEFYSAL